MQPREMLYRANTLAKPQLEVLRKWLKDHGLALSLILSIMVSFAVCSGGTVSESEIPMGDGESYAMRAMTLYGYLHSGQWASFWELLSVPHQSVAPLHYWIFFLLPQSLASMTSYGVIQAVTTYILFALGAWGLCGMLDRPEWAPALFILCASQNISLDFFYFYFVDVPFAASGTIALVWQIWAWRNLTLRHSLLSGLGAGLMFWVKPANAIIFTATYLLAEIVHLLLVWLERKKNHDRALLWQKKIAQHVLAVGGGFIAAAGSALASGGLVSIFRLINDNEISGGFATHLECTGLLRLFYFPLCLTFFYHAKVVLFIFFVIGLISFKINQIQATSPAPNSSATPFPALVMIPLMIAYLVFGEFYSFGIEAKEMRSLVVVLPIFWLSIFWAMERLRIAPGLIFLAAVAYMTCAFSQLFFNSFGTRTALSNSYQLKDDWLSRLPQAHSDPSSGAQIATGILELIQQALPEGSKVADGSEMLFLTSPGLSWTLQHNLALQGRHAPYEFENFLNVDGKICRSALLNARGILIFVHPEVQYSLPVRNASISLMRFCLKSWEVNNFVKIVPIQLTNSEIFGFILILQQPLSDTQIGELIAATGLPELSPKFEFNPPINKHISWPQAWDILIRWKQRKLGRYLN